MRIDAITTCVGQLYVEELLQTLPMWICTVDSITIVVMRGDSHAIKLIAAVDGLDNVRVVATDAFTRDRAQFNKGRALNFGLSAFADSDWILSIDADVIPPLDWRRTVEANVERGCLYGASRVDEYGRVLPNSTRAPLGFFQLWHAADPCAIERPLFAANYAHAGCYDMDFAERWPQAKWRHLPITLIHQGLTRQNWFGVGNRHLVDELRKFNLKAYRRTPSIRFGRIDGR